MFRAIVRKEVLHTVITVRFSAGLILSVLLTLACVIVLNGRLESEYADYRHQVFLREQFLDSYAHTNRIGTVIQPVKPPELFHSLVTGLPEGTASGTFDDNPLPVMFPPMDLVFIVTVVMSLVALLFSYDTFTGERERGTLRLIATQPVSRFVLLAGKWIGGSLSLLIPFLLSLGAGVLYLTFVSPVHWGGQAYLTFGWLTVASILFLSAIYLLGMLVSAFSRHSSTAIVTALFCWMLFIIIIPNFSPYVGAQLAPVPSVTRIQREVERITGIERDELGRELSQEVRDNYARRYGETFTGLMSLSDEERARRLASEPSLRAMYESYREEYDAAWDEANRRQREEAEKLTRDLAVRTEAQVTLSKYISCLSPYACYLYAATDLTGTGLRERSYFRELAERYLERYYAYQEERVAEEKRNNPQFSSNSYIDISGHPRFTYEMEPLTARLAGVLPYLLLLAGFNVVFFAGAFVRFLGYDVR